MILEQDKQDARLKGDLQKKHYTLQASAAVFDAMFKQLYADPIGSIVREIYTNAMEVTPKDGPVPIVTLPSFLSSHFSIRDFGPGMSHDFVMDVYAVGGASTKRLTNEFIGGFGFGAKSGFAYADSFTVTSWHKGVKSIYLMHRDSERIPTVALVSSTPSTEPSGVEFKIATHNDAGRWKEAVLAQLSYMPILPTIKGQEISFLALPKFLSSHPDGDVHLLPSSAHMGSWTTFYGKVIVRMGGPVYHLTDTQVRDLCGIEGYLWIDAPIGSVDLTPSREQLNFSAKTVNFIKSMADKMGKFVAIDFTRQIAACTSLRAARTLYSTLCADGHPTTRRWCPRKWKNRDLDTNDFDLPLILKKVPSPTPTDPNHMSTVRVRCPVARDSTRPTKFSTYTTNISVPPNIERIFVVNPSEKMWAARIQQHYYPSGEYYYQKFFVIQVPDELRHKEQEIIDLFDGWEVIHSKDLPAFNRKAGTSTKLADSYRRLELYSNGSHRLRNSSSMSHQDGGIFVFTDESAGFKVDILGNGTFVSWTADIGSAINTLMAKFNYVSIAAVPKTRSAAFKKDMAAWKSLGSYFEAEIATKAAVVKHDHPKQGDILQFTALAKEVKVPPIFQTIHTLAQRLNVATHAYTMKNAAKLHVDNEWSTIADNAKMLGLTVPTPSAPTISPEWQNILKLWEEIEKLPELPKYRRLVRATRTVHYTNEINEIIDILS